MKVKSFFISLICLMAFIGKINSQTYISGNTQVAAGATEYYEAHFEYALNPYTNISWFVSGGTIIQQGVNPTNTVYCIVEWSQTPGTGYIEVYEDLGGQTASLNILIGGTPNITPLLQNVTFGSLPASICADFGGVSITSFNWEESTDGVNWTYISSVPNCYQPPGASQTKYYRCLLEVQGGYYYTPVASVIIPAFDAGTISASDLHPNYNTSITISNTEASGGFCNPANYQYAWEQSYEGSSWMVIGTGQNYPGGSLIITGRTLIRRKAVCGSETLYSNTLTIIPAYITVDFENLNYVRENTIMKRSVTSWYEADALPIGEKLQSTTYLDGLGRSIQTVDKGVSPAGSNTWKDLVKPFEYDAAGRMTRDFLPYATSLSPGKFKTNALSEQQSYIRSFFNEPALAPTYSLVEYDNSPLNRVMKTMRPGQSWAGSSVGVTNDYDFNYDWEKVHVWALDFNNPGAIPVTDPNLIYPTGKLSKNTSYDEKGYKVITYTDLSGNVILKKAQEEAGSPDLSSEHAGWVCTYYVYDDFGQLRFIVTPKAVRHLDNNGWNLTQAITDELCFRYNYDEKGRAVIKKQPGAGEMSFVYDKKDRLVLSQDANQKAKNQWSFSLYDGLNRTVATGLFDNTANRDAMQTHVNNLNNGVVAVYPYVRGRFSLEIMVENPVAGSSGTNQYCNSCNASTLTYNSITHYDDYNYAGGQSFNTNNVLAYNSGSDPNVEPTVSTGRTTGLVTGEKIRVMDGDTNPFNDQFTFSTAYYDEKARSLQNIGENITWSIDYSTNQYDFSGKLVSSYVNHTYTSTFTVTSKFEYDKIGRLTKLFKNFNATFYKQLAEYSYDELGQLKTKRLAPGYTGTGQNEIEQLTYDYNIQGWLTGINKDYALSNNNYSQWDKFFGMHLGYDNRDALFIAPQYNGNITGAIWKSQGDNSPRKYDYTYDRVDRFTSALFKQKNRPADSWMSTEVDFSTYMEYEDGNGNIKSMKHMGIVPGVNNGIVIDELLYTYKPVTGMAALNGNKLAKVYDNASTGSLGSNNGLLGDFKDGVNTGDDYEYDENGNLVKDLNKNIINGSLNGVIYNFLNKPEKVIIPGKSTIEFTYDAAGEKLRKRVTYSDNSVRITTYISDFIYEQYIPNGGPWGNDELQFVLHEEGRIKIITPHTPVNYIDYELNAGNLGITWPGGKQGVFEYFIKDHLGSTRLVLTEEVQKEYYKATLESSAQAVEAPLFGAVLSNGNPDLNQNEWVKTQIPSSPWPGNSTGVAKLTATETTRKIGPNMILKVMAGDIINTYVDYFYVNNNSTGGGTPVQSVLYSLIPALSVPKTGALSHNNSGQVNTSLTNSFPFNQFITNQPGSGNPNAPKAFLNIIFLDEQFKFIDRDLTIPGIGSDYMRVNSANIPSSLLMQKKAPKNGWVFVYVSNESDEVVYFDNLSVTQEHSRIAEESHYYPHGLKIGGISSRAFNKLQNKYGYQGDFNEEEEETGWDEFDLRMYDAQIGRWTGVDPYDQFASPYIGMSNNPSNAIDEDGGFSIPFLTGTTLLGAAIGFLTSSKEERVQNTLRGAVWGLGIGLVTNVILNEIFSFYTDSRNGLNSWAWDDKRFDDKWEKYYPNWSKNSKPNGFWKLGGFDAMLSDWLKDISSNKYHYLGIAYRDKQEWVDWETIKINPNQWLETKEFINGILVSITRTFNKEFLYERDYSDVGSLVVFQVSGGSKDDVVTISRDEKSIYSGSPKKDLTSPQKTKRGLGKPSNFKIKYKANRKSKQFIDNESKELPEIVVTPEIRIRVRVKMYNSRIKHH